MGANRYEEAEPLGIGARTIAYAHEQARARQLVRAAVVGCGMLALVGAGWSVARRVARRDAAIIPALRGR